MFDPGGVSFTAQGQTPAGGEFFGDTSQNKNKEN